MALPSLTFANPPVAGVLDIARRSIDLTPDITFSDSGKCLKAINAHKTVRCMGPAEIAATTSSSMTVVDITVQEWVFIPSPDFITHVGVYKAEDLINPVGYIYDGSYGPGSMGGIGDTDTYGCVRDFCFNRNGLLFLTTAYWYSGAYTVDFVVWAADRLTETDGGFTYPSQGFNCPVARRLDYDSSEELPHREPVISISAVSDGLDIYIFFVTGGNDSNYLRCFSPGIIANNFNAFSLLSTEDRDAAIADIQQELNINPFPDSSSDPNPGSGSSQGTYIILATGGMSSQNRVQLQYTLVDKVLRTVPSAVSYFSDAPIADYSLGYFYPFRAFWQVRLIPSDISEGSLSLHEDYLSTRIVIDNDVINDFPLWSAKDFVTFIFRPDGSHVADIKTYTITYTTEYTNSNLFLTLLFAKTGFTPKKIKFNVTPLLTTPA